MRLATEIYTHKIEESKLFYCEHFGFEVTLEIDGFIILQHPIYNAYELLFCIPHSPFVHEIFHPPFWGKRMIFQMEVKHVEKEYKRLKVSAIPFVIDLIDEPINGKHFAVTDPNGIYIDIVQYK